MKYVCDICGYVYDPELGDPDNGVAPGTPWEEVPEDWVCPLCGVGKAQFSPEEYGNRRGEGRFLLRALPLSAYGYPVFQTKIVVQPAHLHGAANVW